MKKTSQLYSGGAARFKSPLKILLCLVLLLCASASSAAIHTVSTVDALKTTVSSAESGDVIVLSSGTYTLSEPINVTGKSLMFLGDAVLTFSSDISNGVLQFSDCDVSLLGLTITKANSGDAGGVYVSNNDYNGKVTLIDCTLTENEGHGLYVSNNGKVELVSCTITKNSNDITAGGVVIQHGIAELTNCTISENTGRGIMFRSCDATLNNCIISKNTNANSSGGGVYVGYYSKAAFNDCTITDNTAYNGGGIAVRNDSEASLNRCTITGNQTTTHLGSGVFVASSTVFCTDCTISNNTAAEDGGSVAVMSSGAATLKNCAITGNNGGGFRIMGRSKTTLTDCTIVNNTTKDFGGAGVNVFAANVTLTNCTIAENKSKATDTAGYGGGVSVCGLESSDIVEFINCSLVNNKANTYNEIDNVGESTVNLINTLVADPSPDNAICSSTSGNINFINCALPAGISIDHWAATEENSKDVILMSDWTPVSSEVTVNEVTHTVYKISDNSALNELVSKGVSNDVTPYTDQIGAARSAATMTIGAIEGAAMKNLYAELSADVSALTVSAASPDQTINFNLTVSADYTDGTQKTLTPGEYQISWDISPDISGISIADGVVTVECSSMPYGKYSMQVTAEVSSGDLTKSLTHDITVTKIYSLAINGAPSSAVTATAGTAISTITLTASTDLSGFTWSADNAISEYGLFMTSSDNSFTISGTPVKAGTFSGKITAASGDYSDSATISFNINKATPVITPSVLTLPEGRVRQLYSQDISFTITPAALSYSLDITPEIEGLDYTIYEDEYSISITGLPTKSGTYTLKITASETNEAADPVSTELTLTVAAQSAQAAEKKLDELRKNADAETSAAIDTVQEKLTASEANFGDLPQEKIDKIVENLVNNEKAITKSAVSEASTGTVANTTVPAGSDLTENITRESLKELSTLSIQPKVVQPEAVSSADAVNTINNLSDDQKAKLPEGFDVSMLRDSSGIFENVPSSLTEQSQKIQEVVSGIASELASQDLVVATVLSKLTPNSAGFFPLKVNLRNLTPGKVINFWQSAKAFKEIAPVSASVFISDTSEDKTFFIDSDGNVTDTVYDPTQPVTIVAYLDPSSPAGFDNPFITVNATAADSSKLVSIAQAVANENSSSSNNLSSSGAGCNAGLGLLALGVLALFKKYRR